VERVTSVHNFIIISHNGTAFTGRVIADFREKAGKAHKENNSDAKR